MRVLFAGGGTAGHINPGLAIAKYIREKNPKCEIVFVGTKKGLETSLVPREGFELKLIRVKGFKRKLSFDTVISIKELFTGFNEARKIIKDFKPDLVVGTGGYVCGPVVFSAAMKKIPTLIHEQNAYPGVTNRILSRFSKVTAISFKESEKYFNSSKKLLLTGNPIRGEMLQVNRSSARKKLGIDKDMPLVVIFAGSRGAQKVNITVAQMLKENMKGEPFKVVFATGDRQHGAIMEMVNGISLPSVEIVPYIFDMANTMAAADLVVCRAGAITISELTALGLPSIMIPSPYVTANHQEHNANALEKQGAARVILEKDLTADSLYKEILSMIEDKSSLKKMAVNAGRIGIKDATEKIYDELIKLMGKK